MNFEEKPRPSALDTLRSALPMKQLDLLRCALWIFYIVLGGVALPIAAWLQVHGLSIATSHNLVLFVYVSTGAFLVCLEVLTAPYRRELLEQKQQSREYSRRQKVAEEHQKILERWQHEVKPEGETKNG